MYTTIDRRAISLGDSTFVFAFLLLSPRFCSEKISDGRIRDEIEAKLMAPSSLLKFVQAKFKTQVVVKR
jgi:hypothetical protein